jgi:ribosomal protein S18 acetylase RimI-like enzyme
VDLGFRQCKGTDIDQLLAISKSTFINAFEKDNEPDDFKAYISSAFNEKVLLTQLKNPDSFFYFVYLDRQVIGYVKLNQKQAQTELRAADAMELERIYVLESFQGRGYGLRILRKVQEIALSSQKRFVWLGVWKKNENAIRFYQRHGFTKFGTHPYYIGTDEQTDWLMRCDLTNLPN